ncbi:MAG TPA: protein kinase [Candidatus Eisenbacteria bacterium]|nr:protein kinase [Candidatus Eisenbacteria bacterium]
MRPLSAGDTVSHYRLLSPLAEGGMGQLWLAEDTALPRRVAVKFVNAERADDPVATERLLREARLAASVDHPQVVTVYEAGVYEGRPFLVTQYLEGETLERRLARGPLPVPEAVALARAIADALAEVHALGIVHRDLKPANLMLTPHGPRILDFGISALAGSSRLTGTGELLGTPFAMSPEQFEGRPADARSDLWSLGVVLYQALTGARPFEAATIAALADRVRNANPEPPSHRQPAVTPALDRIVAKLLARDPARRYARAEELIADLDMVSAERGDTAPIPRERAGAGRPRIAVLDFEVLGADPEDRFLAAGLAEDLVVDLARLRGIEVSARGEVLPYRDRNLPPRTVARELGVSHVLHGSVRRSGLRGRINVQLVRASDGHAIWAERFDRSLEDLFEVQAEVSKRVVDALQVRLEPGEGELLERPPSRNPQAYTHYLKALALVDEVRRASNWTAEAELRQAIALDPEFALAEAALADCLARRAYAWWVDPAVLEEARRHADRALALDPGLPQAYVARGRICNVAGDPAGMLEAVTQARMLDSRDPEIMLWVGRSYLSLGRPEQAIGILERALAQRPRDYRLISAYADGLDLLGRKAGLADALARIREVLLETVERNPHDTYARSMLGIALTQLGQVDEGLMQAERAVAEDREDGRVWYNAACAYTQAGRPDQAIDMLQRLLTTHPGFPRGWLQRDPDLAAIRSRPEFAALVARSAG